MWRDFERLIVADMYANVIGQSVIIDEIFSKVRQKVKDEIELDMKLMGVVGELDMVFSSAI